ncbi:MAG: PucR family transcriptional regulator [Clostridiales Family XIII bacterium]|nr:PucR family transcriptional regulator [Clostridiales Family XIII bacterium]
MALTVADILKIGLLREATVVTGEKGLSNIVENVSLLEFDGFEVEGLGSTTLRGNELTVSSLSYFKNDPELFIAFAERMAPKMISCLVIFYLNFIMKELPQRAIDLFRDANIPIIIMPGDAHYAYLDVVMPVAEAIINDKHSNRMFVSDALQQLISMDDEHQTIHSLLEIFRSRVKSDMILTDTKLRPLDWSLTAGTDYVLNELLEAISIKLNGALPFNPSTLHLDSFPSPLEVRFQPIRTNKLAGMLLAVNSSEEQFDIDGMTQAGEVLKLFLRVWRLTRSRLCELDALLQGGASGGWEKKIRNLIVVRGSGGTSLDHITEEISLVRMLSHDNIFETNQERQVTYFSGSIVIAELSGNTDIDRLLDKLRKELHLTKSACVGKFKISNGNSNVQQVYSLIVNALPLACKIFPGNTLYSDDRISFAYEIYKIQSELGMHTSSVFQILKPLMADDRWDGFRKTLETYYLECGGSIAKAAESLDIHVNTMKYRLKVISDLLGMNILSSLCSSRMTLALAILRAQNGLSMPSTAGSW